MRKDRGETAMHDDLGIYLTELLADWMSGSFDEDDVDRLVGKVIAIVEAHTARNERSLADDPDAVDRGAEIIDEYAGKISAAIRARRSGIHGFVIPNPEDVSYRVLRAAETGDSGA